MKKHVFLLSMMAFVIVAMFVAPTTAQQSTPTTREGDVPQYRKLVLGETYFAEGVAVGDFNKDGILDVVSGPYWFAGPDFQKKCEIYEPVPGDPAKYTDNFGAAAVDMNGDGWTDYLIFPHPGTDSYWYENPQGKNVRWQKHPAFATFGNESPMMYDVNKDGRLDAVYNINGHLGFGTIQPSDTAVPLVFHPITPKLDRYKKYTHGVGAGDINGDGLVDLVEAVGWWEQPKDWQEGQPWIYHPHEFSTAAANILVMDVDGDGLNDVVSAWHCHLYGLNWWQQRKTSGNTDSDTDITWEKHVILLAEPTMAMDEFRVSQLHSMVAVDMNGDGVLDIVTGKRFWAHGPTGDKEPDAPALLFWFEVKRNTAVNTQSGGVELIPHIIDDNSGVGTQFTTADLNGDGVPDIVIGNKKGVFVFLSSRTQ